MCNKKVSFSVAAFCEAFIFLKPNRMFQCIVSPSCRCSPRRARLEHCAPSKKSGLQSSVFVGENNLRDLAVYFGFDLAISSDGNDNVRE